MNVVDNSSQFTIEITTFEMGEIAEGNASDIVLFLYYQVFYHTRTMEHANVPQYYTASGFFVGHRKHFKGLTCVVSILVCLSCRPYLINTITGVPSSNLKKKQMINS